MANVNFSRFCGSVFAQGSIGQRERRGQREGVGQRGFRKGMYKGFIFMVLLAALMLALTGCSSKKGADKGPGDEASLYENTLNAQRESRFGDGNIPTAAGESMFRDIRFDFDSAQISDTARQSIEYNAEILRRNPELHVQLEGHCDERGTAEYNLALGAERARAVYEVLVSYGIEPHRMETISYGEEVPLVDGHNESAWQENRRVHLSPFSPRSR